LGTVSVNMIGNYPDQQEMFNALRNCHAENVEKLDELLG
jgi:hypothetical protein